MASGDPREHPLTVEVTLEQLAPLVGGTYQNGTLYVEQTPGPIGPLPLKLGDHDLGAWSVDHVEAVSGLPISERRDGLLEIIPGQIRYFVTLQKEA